VNARTKLLQCRAGGEGRFWFGEKIGNPDPQGRINQVLKEAVVDM